MNILKRIGTGWSKPVTLSAPTAFQQWACKVVSRDLRLCPNFLFYLTPSSCLWKAAGCHAPLKARLSVLTILEAKLYLKGISTTAKHFISVDRCNSDRSDPQALQMASSLFFWDGDEEALHLGRKLRETGCASCHQPKSCSWSPVQASIREVCVPAANGRGWWTMHVPLNWISQCSA